jgi:hypothetical protein
VKAMKYEMKVAKAHLVRWTKIQFLIPM